MFRKNHPPEGPNESDLLSAKIDEVQKILNGDAFYTDIENNEDKYKVVFECLKEMKDFFNAKIKKNENLRVMVNDYFVRLQCVLAKKHEAETTKRALVCQVFYDDDMFGSNKRGIPIKEDVCSAFALLTMIYFHVANGEELPPNFVERFNQVCKEDDSYKNITLHLNQLLGKKFNKAVWEFHESECADQEPGFELDAHLSNNLSVPSSAKEAYKKLFECKGFSGVVFPPTGNGYGIVIPGILSHLRRMMTQSLPSEGIMNTATHSFSP